MRAADHRPGTGLPGDCRGFEPQELPRSLAGPELVIKGDRHRGTMDDTLPGCSKQVRRLPSHGGAYSGIPGRRVLLYADHWDPFGQSSDYSQCRHEPHHQLCPAHALCHPSEPLAEANAVFQIGQQKTVPLHGGALVRQEARPEPAQAGVLTVTELLPNLCKEPTTPASQSLTPRAPPSAEPRSR